MEAVIRTLRDWCDGSVPPPFGIELAPTLRCNLDCLFCWRYGRDSIDSPPELPLDEYRKIIAAASRMGVREVKLIGGGDACVRPDTFEILPLIKEGGMFGYMCTNGTIFKEAHVGRLVELGWDHLKISFHGAAAATHDDLVNRPGAFDRVMRTLRLFAAHRSRLGVELPRIEFGVVLVNRNYREVVDIVRLAAEEGVDSVFIEPITVYTEMGESLRLSEEDTAAFGELAREAKALADRHGIETNLDNFYGATLVESTNRMRRVLYSHDEEEDPFLDSPCFEPFYRMGIRVDGRVGPCGFFDEDDGEYIAGKDLEEIWTGPYFTRRRREMLERRLGRQCERCCTTLVMNNQIIRDKLRASTGGSGLLERAIRFTRRGRAGNAAREEVGRK